MASKLAALMGKPEKVMLGEVELDIKPLSLEDMELFALDKDAGSKEQMVVMKSMVKKVIKEAVPDATDEEIYNISVEHLNTLMEAIMRVNKLDKANVPGTIKR